MPRVLVMLVLAALALIAFGVLNQQKSRSRDTFRPKRRVWPEKARQQDDNISTIHVVDADELDGVRDAFSSAPINSGDRLFRCGGCLAFYEQASVDVLAQSNRGCCITCGSKDIAAVTVATASTH